MTSMFFSQVSCVYFFPPPMRALFFFQASEFVCIHGD